MKLYVASSWRNNTQPEVVEALRAAGHEVYDFRNPKPGDRGFHWSDISPNWQAWTPELFRDGLHHSIALDGYGSDWAAMRWAEGCVLVLPCGRSAHLEAGYFVGAEKPLFILLAPGCEPELMYRMAHETDGDLCLNMEELLKALRQTSRPVPDPAAFDPAKVKEILDTTGWKT